MNAKSRWAQVGDDGRRMAQRALMLETIASVGWNIHAIAEALGIAPPNVITALQDVAPEEYAQARAEGKLSKGTRRA